MGRDNLVTLFINSRPQHIYDTRTPVLNFVGESLVNRTLIMIIFISISSVATANAWFSDRDVG